ncbi:MAG: transglycosylase SLT domain-containing protein [Fimbriimonadaceae bacterium]
MKLITILAVVCATTLALADSVTDYIGIRKANKISGVSGVQALDSLVGTKIFEIKARLKGIVKVGDDAALVLENPDQTSLSIRTGTLPDWLDGTDVDIRLIVKASREGELAPLETTLLAVIPEAMIKKYDPVPVTPKAKTTKSTTTSTTSSRDPRNPLSGPIGRRGNSASRSSSTPRSSSGSKSASEAIPIYADYIKKRNRRLSDDQCYAIADSVIRYSLQYGVDPRLVMAMAIQESNFNPNATSHAGAQGVLQLMPGTAAGLGVGDSYDITQNIRGAVKLIASHYASYLKKTGSHDDARVLMLAAYNAGPSAVKRFGGVPPYNETQNYVKRILAIYYELIS